MLSTACGDELGRDGSPNPQAPGLSAGEGDDGLELDVGGGGDDGLKLDVDGGPPTPTDGCYAADLLFVIDNSGSMCEAQEGLAQVVPDLVDAMFDSLPLGIDLHVGIVTTSFSHGGSHMETGCAAAEGPATIEAAFITDERVDFNGYQGRLFEYDGLPYFAARTDDDSARDELKDWFSGAIVDVGCSGGAFDFPVAAAGYAAAAAGYEAEASNAGFVRDAGAVLGIFVLTNETDHSPGGIASYRDMILEAKQQCGGAECVLTAGLLAPNCVPDYDPPIWQFLNAFGATPAWASIHDPSLYEGVVAQTLTEGLVQTCDEIEPVG